MSPYGDRTVTVRMILLRSRYVLAMTTATARIADRYRLLETEGPADLGVVWHAHDDLLDRDVAVREVRLPSDLTAQERERMAEQMLAGARSVAAIDTPAAVRVFDIVEDDGRPWIVSELVRGQTLTEVLAEGGAIPSGEVARIGLCLLEALEAAHRADVAHGDVKPSNVIVGADARIALTGFGLVTDDPAEESEVVVGAPAYLPPERALGGPPTPAGDYWAMAATLWTAAEGRAPYEGATPRDVLAAVAGGKPPRCTRCSEPLAEILLSMMSLEPRERPSGDRVRAVLEEVCRESRRESDEAGVASRRRKGLRRSFDRATVVPAARQPGEEQTWPLVVAFLLLVAATTAALSLLVGTGPN